MTKFHVGQKCTIGNEEHNKPEDIIQARVSCVDVVGIHGMDVLVLGMKAPGIEQVYQFSEEGLCLLALNRAENESHYKDSNLYAVKEPANECC